RDAPRGPRTNGAPRLRNHVFLGNPPNRRDGRMTIERRAAQLALLLGLALALLAGQALAQSRLIIASGTDAVTLDAHYITDSPSATVSEHITEPLFELTPDGQIVPHLVESYDVSDDGLV